MTKALVFNIQRFSVNDGPGIRTTVFIKGCPLDCLWCHNPESKRCTKELMYSSDKCVGCARCVEVCPTKAHSIDGGIHTLNRELCVGCGSCAEVCFSDALELCGKEMSPEEALREVMKDEIFYSTSEGGVTLSGGEPLYSFDFTLELLRLCKEKGLHTAIETSGSAPTEKILEVAKFVDLFLFDCKESDPERHREFVGADNALILKNLKAISDAGKEIILRCPIIPGYNDREDHFLAIAALSEKLPSVSAVEIEPYHPLGESKANKLGREYPLSGKPFAEKSDSEKWIKFISEKTKKPVRLG